MSRIRVASFFALGMFFVGCQGEPSALTSDSSSPLGLAAYGCHNAAFNAQLDNVSDNNLARTLGSLCKSAEHENNANAAVIDVYTIWKTILSASLPGPLKVGLQQASCTIVAGTPGFECPHWKASVLTSGGACVATTATSPAECATTLSAALVNFDPSKLAGAPAFGLAVTELDSVPTFAQDCTAFSANSPYICEGDRAFEVNVFPSGAVIYEADNPVLLPETKVGLCANAAIHIATQHGGQVSELPSTTAPPQLTCAVSIGPTTGWKGLAWRATEPIRSLLATPLYAGKLGGSVPAFSPFQGSLGDRTCNVGGQVTYGFNPVSQGVLVWLYAGWFSGLNPTATPLRSAVTDVDGNYGPFTNLAAPSETSNKYTVLASKTEHNQSWRGKAQIDCTAQAVDFSGTNIELSPGAN